MTKVYCYDRCSTFKKALSKLDENGVEYQKIDIKGDLPDEAILRSLHKKSGLPLKKFFNIRGMLYRELELSAKLPAISEDDQFKLLTNDGMLVKRLFLVTDGTVCAGFKEAEWKTVLKVEGLYCRFM